MLMETHVDDVRRSVNELEEEFIKVKMLLATQMQRLQTHLAQSAIRQEIHKWSADDMDMKGLKLKWESYFELVQVWLFSCVCTLTLKLMSAPIRLA